VLLGGSSTSGFAAAAAAAAAATTDAAGGCPDLSCCALLPTEMLYEKMQHSQEGVVSVIVEVGIVGL